MRTSQGLTNEVDHTG